MVLLEFFKNLFKAPVPSYFEDIYHFDYPALLENANYLGEYESNGITRYKYACKLQTPFLNVFEKLRIEVWKKGSEFKSDDLINLFFSTKRKSFTDEEIDYVIFSVVEACRNDEKYEDNKIEAAYFKTGTYGSMIPVLIRAKEGDYHQVDIFVVRKEAVEFRLDLCLSYADIQRLAVENQY